eukprot:scaffold8075_cov115-Isochrysis_galbana.AAC.8
MVLVSTPYTSAQIERNDRISSPSLVPVTRCSGQGGKGACGAHRRRQRRGATRPTGRRRWNRRVRRGRGTGWTAAQGRAAARRAKAAAG